ncbi:unnamed protein product [Diamesa hyperborea]
MLLPRRGLTRLFQGDLNRYTYKRYSGSRGAECRVRFAPSPTGFLHLGGLRTALFNYLFAKSRNGKFIIRIEDTDQTRLVEGATEQLCKDLEWAGIIPDEGPAPYNGEYGPYIQSQRLETYQKYINKLLDSGNAYHCFCSERRLDLLRKEALRTRQIPKYDNRCRHLTPVQVAEKIAKNDKYCIRFQLTDRGEAFKDMIYGNFVYYVAQNEGDPIILKSDGFPTYHFANVIDDHLMRITHVLRGIEWQISTPKHLMMYRALGWTPPQFGHLPLIMNADGSKLSKRQNDIKLEFYRDKGVFPQALLNYITQAGGGFDRESSTKLEWFDMKQLTEKFDVDRINSNSSRLNPDLLDDLNRLEILHQVEDPVKSKILVNHLRTLVKEKYPISAEQLDLDEEHILNVLKWGAKRVTSINELVEGKLSFLWVLPILKKDEADLNAELIDSLVEELKDENFSKQNLQLILKDFSSSQNLTFSKFMKNLRTMLSGLKEGPGVAEMMEILGRESTLERIERLKKKEK